MPIVELEGEREDDRNSIESNALANLLLIFFSGVFVCLPASLMTQIVEKVLLNCDALIRSPLAADLQWVAVGG